jgi:hypothetical protein
MPGNKIGMKVRFEDVPDGGVVFASRFQIDLHIALRVHHQSFPTRDQQVRSMRQTAQIELLEVHVFLQ